MKPLTQRKTEALVEEWADRFRLQEWFIRVHAVPLARLDEEGRVGTVGWDEKNCVADITIATLRPKNEVLDTVIHELVHLSYADVDLAWNAVCGELAPSTQRVMRELFLNAAERATVRLTNAFVKLQVGDRR